MTVRFGGREGLSSAKQEWLRMGRVCHSDLFEKYFTLFVPANDVSQAELERLINSAGDRRAFLNQARALRSRGLLRVVLERADAYREEIPIQSIPMLIRSLCELSESFEPPEPGAGFFFSDPLMIAWRLVYFGLRREKDKRKRFEILRTAFVDSDALLLPLDIVDTEQRSQEKDNQGFEYLVEESDLSSLKSLVLEKVRMHAQDGRLRKHPRADEVLFWWARLGSLDEVRSWLGSQLTAGKNAAWVLSLLMSRASSNGETRYYIKLSFAEKYVDVQAVEKILLELDEKSLSDKEKVAVREFQRALRRKRAGKPELDMVRRHMDESDD